MSSTVAATLRRAAQSASGGLQSSAVRSVSSSSRLHATASTTAGRGSARLAPAAATSRLVVSHLRGFSSTSTRSDGSGRTTVKDPEPQTGLYYHPTQISISRGTDQPTSTVDGWAISFLPTPSASEDAIIAYVLPTSSSSQDAEPAAFVRANPDRIRINAAGWKIMHDVLKNDVVPNDDLLKFEASTRESGWAHLTDLRHPLMPGRIATPENIIASVAFTEGKLNVESYEENKSYRLVTGYEGPIQMADSWIEKLRKRFEAL
ncbi:conserved hypothetical protein [Sporisorium reilianum SRZ2]|uniref:Uncharacterized protein n=1 Tax=Sporisorium reilianum (strain SRZ2) TaxID=999809 RepID=E6ZXI5_SPORE|nr:conserved hypothetical protein [Sporisorium reilianum SRZ2]